jgi:hypothetical protein
MFRSAAQDENSWTNYDPGDDFADYRRLTNSLKQLGGKVGCQKRDEQQ